jgi:hypothetical protein
MYTGTLDQGPSEEIPSASKISTMLFFSGNAGQFWNYLDLVPSPSAFLTASK